MQPVLLSRSTRFMDETVLFPKLLARLGDHGGPFSDNIDGVFVLALRVNFLVVIVFRLFGIRLMDVDVDIHRSRPVALL